MKTAAIIPPRLASLVAQLPEIYQPIYGHPNLSITASRQCDDRLKSILKVYSSLNLVLKRPLRVLDLGCAQGYLSFSLAAKGASVYGVDLQKENIAVCQSLADEYSNLSTSFQVQPIEIVIEHLKPDEFDLVLGLSVFHHLIHQHGTETVRGWLSILAEKVEVAIFEFAMPDEPLYWAISQPDDPQELMDEFAFIHEISKHSTHLSKIKRPLYFASNKYWYLDGKTGSFEKWTLESHALALKTHQGTRRYYFSNDLIIKTYRIIGERAAINLEEFKQEVDFLSSTFTGFEMPKLILSGQNEKDAWLVRQMSPGELLLEIITDGRSYNASSIIRDILEQLCILEAAGLYHNDVRVWNVLIQPGGKARLLDYGAISKRREDCQWPQDVVLAFWIFVREVATGNVPPPFPLRQPFISPYNLPDPYRRWAEAMWAYPSTEWSFQLMRKILEYEIKAAPWMDQPDFDIKFTQGVRSQILEMGISLYDLRVSIDLGEIPLNKDGRVGAAAINKLNAIANKTVATSNLRTKQDTFALWMGAIEKHLDSLVGFEHHLAEGLSKEMETVRAEAHSQQEALQAHAQVLQNEWDSAISELNQKLNGLQVILNAKEAERQQLEATLNAREAERQLLEVAKVRIEELAGELAVKTDTLIRQQAHSQRLQNEWETEKVRNEELARELAIGKDALVKQQAQSQWLQNEWETAKVRHEKLAKEVAIGKDALIEKQAQNQWLRNEWEAVKVRLEELVGELSVKSEALVTHEAALAELKARSQWLQNEWDAAKVKVGELNRSSNYWQTVADQHERDLQAVFRRKSWRITWPLRKAFQLIRWLFRLPKRIIKGLVLLAMRFVLARPVMKFRLSRISARYPRTKDHLMRLAFDNNLIAHPSELTQEMHIIESRERTAAEKIDYRSGAVEIAPDLSHLSPQAHHIYLALKQAITQHQKEKG